MLSDASLSRDYWAEEIDIACYLVNKSSTLTLFNKIPYEAWVGRNPSLTHLRVFGCDAFVHIPKQRRKKHDNKS